jgi:hypothetical protein
MLVVSGATVVLAYSGNGEGANCAPAAGLNLAVGEPPQPGPAGSVAADGSLALYCRGVGTNSRAGTYTAGVNTDEVTAPTAGQICSVNISYENAQVLGQPFQESEYEPGAVTVFPLAFWTGTIDAGIVPASGSFGDFWGSVTDTAPARLGVDWAAASRYGPAPPSAQPGSGLATGGLIMSGLENETLQVSVTTVPGDPGKWEQGANGEWLCDGPRVSLTVRPVADEDSPPLRNATRRAVLGAAHAAAGHGLGRRHRWGGADKRPEQLRGLRSHDLLDQPPAPGA